MAGVRVKGIDVSHYQGAIDWAAVAKYGVAFAFIKATDGVSRTDTMFRRNWQMAGVHGIRRGAYHFFRVEQDSERQARSFLAMLDDEPGELPTVLDFEMLEDVSINEGLSRAKVWMEIVQAGVNRRPMLYTGPAFWRATMKDSKIFADFPLWIGHYTTAPEPIVPSTWKRWTFWQYSEKGTVPGVNGPVDLDFFNGKLTELDAFCGRIPNKSAMAGS